MTVESIGPVNVSVTRYRTPPGEKMTSKLRRDDKVRNEI